jgi:hypothetical protein
LPMAQAPDLDGRGHFDQALLSFRQLDSARKQKAGQGLHVSATEPWMRAECWSLGFHGGVHEGHRMFGRLVGKTARRIFLAASLPLGISLRSWHELILMEAALRKAGRRSYAYF